MAIVLRRTLTLGKLIRYQLDTESVQGFSSSQLRNNRTPVSRKGYQIKHCLHKESFISSLLELYFTIHVFFYGGKLNKGLASFNENNDSPSTSTWTLIICKSITILYHIFWIPQAKILIFSVLMIICLSVVMLYKRLLPLFEHRVPSFRKDSEYQ